MKERQWIVVCGKYNGLEKRAAEIVVAAMQPYLKLVVVVKESDELTETEKKENDLFLLGTPDSNSEIAKLQAAGRIACGKGDEGYAITSEKSAYNEEKRMIVVAANGERGVLYGVVDATGVYFKEVALPPKAPKGKTDVRNENYFPSAFNADTLPFRKESEPSVKKRALWTWGHCIYDYKRFFKNMALLKLNQAVIWNDYAPVNAKEVVAYAKSWGVEIFWGSPWGWDTSMPTEAASLEPTEEVVQALVGKYADEYADTGAAGLYFQSFTETSQEKIGGKYIAEAVVDFVNAAAKKMYERFPNLELQFGLHADSVKNRIFAMEKVDPRIRIVWENCGDTPYSYDPNDVSNFDETMAFSEKIATLRGKNEKFGAVLKGMPTLDWDHFFHIRGPFALGVNHERFTRGRDEYRRELWKHYQADWLVNGWRTQALVKRLVAKNGGDMSLQLLVEDGMFEETIYFPAALCAESLWDANEENGKLVSRVASCPWVNFANL